MRTFAPRWLQEHILTFFALSTLFLGYTLTVGLQIIDPDKVYATRSAALLIFVSSIILRGKVSISTIFLIPAMLLFFIANGNGILINLIYIGVIIEGLRGTPPGGAAIAILAASVSSILVHFTFLSLDVLDVVWTDVNGRVRSALGFANANQMAAIYLSAVFSSLYVHACFRTKWSLSVVFILVCIAVPMLQVADSRTSLLSVGLLFSTFFLFGALSKISATQDLLSWGGAIVPGAASLATLFLLTQSGTTLDQLLSLRPRFFADFMRTMDGPDLFLGWSPVEGAGVDNGYLMLLSAVGLPIFVLAIVALSIRLLRLRWEYLALAVVGLTSSVFESFLVRPELPICIAFFSIIDRKNSAQPSQTSRREISA